jgi:hypothetical protein
MANAESVAGCIRSVLEGGMLAGEYEAERQTLELTRGELDARATRRDWLWVGLVLLSMIALGIAIGLRIAQSATSGKAGGR